MKMIEITGLESLMKGIDHLEHFPVSKMNKARAKAFKKFMTDQVKSNSLYLRKLSPVTIALHGKDHPPMENTGGFTAAVRDKQEGDISVAGWIQESGRPKGAKIQWREIASLHISGYRVPLTGNKGERVRAYFAAHGIFFKKTTKFLVVLPRDVLGRAYYQYELTGKDDEIIDRFFDNELRSAFGV